MISDAEIMAQVQAAFLSEQAEHRQVASELLLELERAPDHPQRAALLDQLFREAHSLKGSARAAQQPAIEQLAHRIEDLLSAVRAGRVALTAGVCDPIYAALDVIGALASQGNKAGAASLAAHEGLLAMLAQIVEVPAMPQPGGYHNGGNHHAELVSDPPQTTVGPERLASIVPHPETVRLSTNTLDQLLGETGELITCTVRVQQRAREARLLAEVPITWRRLWRRLSPVLGTLRAAAPTLDPTVHHLERPAAPSVPWAAPGDEAATRGALLGEHELTLLLDTLGRANGMIGALEQQLAALARASSEDHARLATVTERLHEQVRRTRMLPVATLVSPLRLQLRDLARSADKQVRLHVDDGGAEADRQVLEQLRDVLLHLLRNALDHGIEPAATRELAGKPPVGQISLTAAVQGDQLTVSIADDGAGLDVQRIRQHALAIGLITPADMSRLGDEALIDVIFQPGFSTRQTVSALSGRGVGLDIVRSRVERMHGRVRVQSVVGAGCTFSVSVPLSLTSTQALLVQVGAARYMLPLDAVQRIVMVSAGQLRTLEGGTVMLIDEGPVPLMPLADLLEPGTSAGVRDRMLAVLIGSGERLVACTVDAVLSEQQLVVQHLPAPLYQLRGIAGATILADGLVVPILDSVDLLRVALGTRTTLQTQPQQALPVRQATILVVDDSITTRTLEKNILESAGYRVQLATNGAEAFTLLQQLRSDGGCDLVLSDVDMPVVNGFELTRHIREDAHSEHLPVILVTSLDTPEDRERGIAAGADAYIVKRSFDQQQLLDTVAQLVA